MDILAAVRSHTRPDRINSERHNLWKTEVSAVKKKIPVDGDGQAGTAEVNGVKGDPTGTPGKKRIGRNPARTITIAVVGIPVRGILEVRTHTRYMEVGRTVVVYGIHHRAVGAVVIVGRVDLDTGAAEEPRSACAGWKRNRFVAGQHVSTALGVQAVSSGKPVSSICDSWRIVGYEDGNADELSQ